MSYEAEGDRALVHGLRGQPSNRRLDAARRQKVLQAYRRRYADFGPTFACEKLASEGLPVSPQTLRRWLIAEGLWQRQRRRDPHRSRRPRRCCFGELVQMDASIHDWLEGRGEDMVLISMIDDAASRAPRVSTRPARPRRTWICWGVGCVATVGPWRCTQTGTAFSSHRTRARATSRRRDAVWASLA